MSKKSISLALILGVAAAPFAAFAEDSYQHDATIGLGENTEGGDGIFYVNYRYYLAPVKQGGTPYLLSGYLSQTSNIGGGFSSIGSDYNSYELSGRYVFDSKWFFSASYSQHDVNFGSDGDNYSIGTGYYFNDWSSAFILYSQSSFEGGFDSDYYAAKYSTDTDTFLVGVDSFITFESTQGLYLSATYGHMENEFKRSIREDDVWFNNKFDANNSELGLTADWYINRSWSVGTNYSYYSDDFDDNWGLNSSYYWPITASLAAVFQVQTNLDSDIDGFGYGVAVNGRF